MAQKVSNVPLYYRQMFGHSKERPILGDHPKAHIHEIRQISCGFHVKSGRFHADFMKSGRFQVRSTRFRADFRWNLPDFMKSGGFQVKSGRFQVKSTYKSYKSNISRKTLQFYGVLWEGYVMFSHEIRRISKDQLPGMVSPMFVHVVTGRSGHRCCLVTDRAVGAQTTQGWAGLEHVGTRQNAVPVMGQTSSMGAGGRPWGSACVLTLTLLVGR